MGRAHEVMRLMKRVAAAPQCKIHSNANQKHEHTNTKSEHKQAACTCIFFAFFAVLHLKKKEGSTQLSNDLSKSGLVSMGVRGEGTTTSCYCFVVSAIVLAYLFVRYGREGLDEFAELRCFVRTFFL